MDKFLWLCFIVPVMTAGMVIHLKMKDQVRVSGYDQQGGSVTPRQQLWYIIPKCMSTWMAVFTAAAGLWQQKSGTYAHAWWILAALILFMIADAFLEIKFYIGMAVFAVGHLVLIGWILSFGYFNAASILIWCILMAAALALFKKELVQFKEHPMQYLMMLYPAVLAAIIAVAAFMPLAMGTDFAPLAVGMILFGISDMFVGKNFFSPLGKTMNYVILILYYSGIECIALMTWM